MPEITLQKRDAYGYTIPDEDGEENQNSVEMHRCVSLAAQIQLIWLDDSCRVRSGVSDLTCDITRLVRAIDRMLSNWLLQW
jgi:hypothetical protein